MIVGIDDNGGDGWVGLTLGLSPGIAEGRFNFESKREPSQAQMGPRNSWEAATSKHGMNAWPSGLLPPGAVFCFLFGFLSYAKLVSLIRSHWFVSAFISDVLGG